MTPHELAALLDGREYGEEITLEEEVKAFQNRLLVVFGASDDLTELRGHTHDEVGTYEGGDFEITAGGKVIDKLDRDAEELVEELREYGWRIDPPLAAVSVKAEWCPEDAEGASWRMTTVPEGVPFKIMEGDELYCIGCVVAVPTIGTKGE